MSGVLSSATGSAVYPLQVESNHKVWKRDDYEWDPYNMEADMIKPDTRAAVARVGPSVSTRSSKRVQKEPAPGPPPRGKGPLKCQVDSCQTSLEGAKEYHVRYRICERCLKLQEVVREGRKERFCQQCGRFHSLDQFDGEKRSCRVRLNRHNSRRRKNLRKSDGASKHGEKSSKVGKSNGVSVRRMKPEGPKAATLMDDAVLEETLEDLLGASFDFSAASNGSAQEMLPDGTSVMSSCMEATTVHTDDGPFLSHMEESEMGTDSISMGFMGPLQPESGTEQTHATYPRDTTDFFGTIVRQEVPFRAAQGNEQRAPQEALLLHQLFAPQQLRVHNPRQEPSSATQLNSFAHLAPMADNGMPTVSPSPPATSHSQNHQSGVYNGNHFSKNQSQNESHSLMEPFAPSMKGGGSYALHWIPVRGEVRHQQPPPLVYGVPVHAAPANCNFGYVETGLLQTNSEGVSQVAMLPMLPQDNGHALMQDLPNIQPLYLRRQERHAPQQEQSFSIASTLDSLDLAKSIIESPLGVYDSAVRHNRMSIKMNSCVTPSQLPRDLKSQVHGVLPPCSIESYLRPGCVHLTIKYSLSTPEVQEEEGKLSAREAAKWLVNQPHASLADVWHVGIVLVQVHDEIALIRDGKVTHVLDGQASVGVFPALERVSPLAVFRNAPQTVTLHGANLAHSDNVVLGYCQGMDVYERPVLSGQAANAVKINLGQTSFNGAVQLYVLRGCFQTRFKVGDGLRGQCVNPNQANGFCGTQPVLVVDDEGVADEINQLEDPQVAEGVDVDTFLMDLDAVLELIRTLKSNVSDGHVILRPFSEAEKQTIFEVACRSFVFATSKGWPNVARMINPLFTLMGKSISTIISTMYFCGRVHPWTLLHLAVLSKNPQMIDYLMSWSKQYGCTFGAASGGPNNVTPMHLAVLLTGGPAMAAKLTALCPDFKEAWRAKTVDGLTPYQMAVTAGKQVALRAVLKDALPFALSQQEPTFSEEYDSDKESDFDYEIEDEFGIDPESGEVVDFGGLSVNVQKNEQTGASGDEEEQEDLPESRIMENVDPEDSFVVETLSLQKGLGAPPASSEVLKLSADSAISEASKLQEEPTCAVGLEEASPTCSSGVRGVKDFHSDEEPIKEKAKRRLMTRSEVMSMYETQLASTFFDRWSSFRSALLLSSCGVFALCLRMYLDRVRA